jgi:DNA polymerase-4
MTWRRVIVHADMDAFYAAVEQRDRPELRGKPLLIGSTSGRGVVVTASYEARPFGVGSAMAMAIARRRCPQAIVVSPRMERYQDVSRQIMEVFRDFSPQVEAISLDEAFLDMSGTEHLFGDPAAMGQRIKDAVWAVTGLTASVGVAGTKYVAKVASDLRKPDGLTVVTDDEVYDFLWPLPVRRLWGAGPKTVSRLEALGLHKIGDVASADPAWLRRRLGRAGTHFWRLAHADDPREVAVATQRGAKSIGSERTLAEDIHGRAAIEPYLRAAADRIANRLRKKGLQAWGVRVKLKTADFELLSRQLRLSAPTDLGDRIHGAGLALLERFSLDRPFRLVGMAVYDLCEAGPVQGELFGLVAQRSRVERAVDTLHDRFGASSLRRAADLERGDAPRVSPTLDFLDEGTTDP